MCGTRCPKVRVAVKLAQLPSAVPLDMDKDKERLADAVSSKYVSSVPILTADDETATTATINDNGGNHQCVSHEMTSNGVHENVSYIITLHFDDLLFTPCVDQKTSNNDFTISISANTCNIDSPMYNSLSRF